MKKLFSVLLIAAMLLTCCVPAMAETTTVKFWTHMNEGWNASYRELIEEFEAEYPEIHIEYETFPYSDLEGKIQTSLIAGDVGADVYEVWGGWMLDLTENDVLAEMPAEFAADLEDDAYAPVLGTLEKDGKYYGAPVELNIEYGGILVNKHLFEDNGYEYPTTWQEVLDIATEVAEPNGETMDMRGLDFASTDNLVFNWLAMILQKGGSYLKEDGSVDFTSPEAVEAMEELVYWMKDLHLTNTDCALEPTGLGGYDWLAMDESYMVTRGPWVMSTIAETYGLEYGVDFDYIKQPPFYEDGGEQKWVAETGWSLCVANSTTVADAAWTFVEFLMRPDVLRRHNIDCGQIPPRKSVANDPEFLAEAPYLEPLVDIFDYAQFIGKFNTDILKTYIKQMYVSLVTEDGTYASVEEACQKLTDDLAANMKIYA